MMSEYPNLNQNTKFVFLQGGSNVGKTTTLKLLYQDFISAGATIVNIAPHWLKFLTRKDFACVLEFGNDRICICSQGDNSSAIDNGLKIANEYHCNVFLGAMKQKGETVDFINELRSAFEHICVIRKLSTDNDNFDLYTNKVQAKVLMDIYYSL